MKKNVGTLDKVMRIIVGVVILAIGLSYESLWGVVGIVPLVSGLTGFCPLYAIFDISTRKIYPNKNPADRKKELFT